MKAPKSAWHVGADLAGYARAVGNFSYVVVRGAGHMVPGDQPVRALDLITRFVEGRPKGPASPRARPPRSAVGCLGSSLADRWQRLSQVHKNQEGSSSEQAAERGRPERDTTED